ncbi:MAG TPA: hypothetical protein VLE53_10510 [Gemmatimonadaceae bacterium]|nr:hypothetical protein [Gemmatimonadaceae bacterium]
MATLAGALPLLVMAAGPAAAQRDLPPQPAPASNLGLTAVGALGFHLGAATSLEHTAEGYEGGALVDLGWVRGRALRLQGEVAVLRATLAETVEVEDETYRDYFIDLTGSLSLVLQGGGSRGRFAPFLLAGLGVHALSSAFGSIPIDRRYNGNTFGSHVGAGGRIWLGGSGRNGLFVEVRRSIAEHVNRTTVRVGGLVFYNDLVRPDR